MKKILFKESFKDYLFMLIGILCIAFALKSLLMPNKFFDGGVTGIALLLYKKYHINIALIFIALNIPFLLLGGKLINKSFAIKSIIGVIILGLCLQFIPFPEVSHDKLIVSVFGGFFIGLGVGFGMKSGIALDGIEVLAVYTGKKVGFSMSEIILGINILIFLIAGIFFGLEAAFYSMLTYFVASKTIDYVVEGFEEFTGVTIISSKSEEVKQFLVLQMGKGITVYKGERGFMKDSFEVSTETDIVYTVVTRLEVRKLKSAIHEIDEKAFIFSSSIKETAGGILKKKHAH
ncbi:YitT family protein [Flavobacterium sp. xlx-214]|uniref:YitT family protein n=2 Tax=Flavobacterium TaxID=237 RepID=UPI0013D0656F|nr:MULTISPECIES: YitT family protein [unclassified Flavobacterium]MBA5792318.1 YitT family protein [Flavobacterium sp. xlx-221]QMI82365.1 YitT family protein [Flavobacterium sp. xlx-214]